jgi:hypothetical protein
MISHEVKESYQFPGDNHYTHVFTLKNVLLAVNTPFNGYQNDQIDVISKVFRMSNLHVDRIDKKDLDITVTAYDSDIEPNNSIGRAKWTLRQLDKIIGLKLED